MAASLAACRGLQAAKAQRGVIEQPHGRDDRAREASGLGIDAQRVVRLEIEIALDAETKNC